MTFYCSNFEFFYAFKLNCYIFEFKKSLHVVYAFSSSIVLVCYSIMFWRVRKEGAKMKELRYSKNHLIILYRSYLNNFNLFQRIQLIFPTFSRLETVKKQIDERDMEMTWSVLVIFFCSFVCQTVFIFFGNTTSAKGGIGLKNSQSRTIARCINWTQYAVDPFIYAIRNKEFRQAYKDVFYPVTMFYKRLSEISLSSKNTYSTKNSKNSGRSSDGF